VFETICLVLIFVLMVVLIRRGVDVSYALVVGALCVGLSFGVAWRSFPHGFLGAMGGVFLTLGKAAVAPDSLILVGLVLLIQFLGHALKHVASLQRLIAVLKALLPDRRAAMAVAPAFIGLLPMPGGALFSAPMVGELTDDLDVPGEDRVLINYWFRHVWEWTWPLYPGILFASTIVGAPLGKLILAQSPLTLGAIAIGTCLCFRRVKLPSGDRERAARGSWRELAGAVWPVGLVIVLTAALGVANAAKVPYTPDTKLALLIALLVVNPVFLASKRVPWREVLELVKKTLSLRLIVLVYGVVAFGYMLKSYETVEALPAIYAQWGVPPLALLFLVPFVVGLLTGYMPAAVGTCFPLLIPLIVSGAAGAETIDYGRLAFAYAGGLFGVLLSPVHMCLVLSREYFSADFGRVYRRLAVMMALLALVAVGTLALWAAVGLR